MAQDDIREKEMRMLFNLEQQENRSRHGTDAILEIDGEELEFELKSVTRKGGLTTVRDFGPDHIAKWKNKHWLIAVYQDSILLYCKYGSPAEMAPWIEEKWNYIKADFELAKRVPSLVTLEVLHDVVGKKDIYSLKEAKKLHKAQYSSAKYIELMDVFEESGRSQKPAGYSPTRMLSILQDRARYVIERGSTLNNPHIPASYFSNWEKITKEHAVKLRQLVRLWIAANKPQAHVPLQAQSDRT